MALSRLDLQAIGAAGAGFSIDGAKFSRLDLQAIAASVAQGGGQLVVKNAHIFSRLDLQAIAGSGKGHVTLDLGQGA